MVICSRPECQTTAGCQCQYGRPYDYCPPYRHYPTAIDHSLSNLPKDTRTPLSEYSDAEIRAEFYMRTQKFLGDQRIGVTAHGSIATSGDLNQPQPERKET